MKFYLIIIKDVGGYWLYWYLYNKKNRYSGGARGVSEVEEMVKDVEMCMK